MKKKVRKPLAANRQLFLLLLLAVALVSWLMLYRLGSLVGGLSATERLAATAPVGWHGIYHSVFYLPLTVVRSVDFYLFPQHGQTLTRLPNTLFGALTIFSFAWLVRLWHGNRTAVFASVLFATSAWVLHASRLASFDVLYLWAIPTLLVTHLELQRRTHKAPVFYGSMLVWGIMLYIPGMVWLVLADIYLQRKFIAAGWRHFRHWWQRLGYLLAGLVWLPLLAVDLQRPGNLRTWLGAPQHFVGPLTMLKHFVGVFVHLFIRGPEYPQLWLCRAPILDILTLTACVIGIYFYAQHSRVARSRLLATFFFIGVILVTVGGPVSLSLLVPVLYLAVATGIAYLVREWLKVFPVNPLARSIGLGLIILAVALSCLYNLRAYFVAWPHNQTTQTVFRDRP